MLTGIELNIENFWMGLRGLPEPAKKVTPSASYKFDLEFDKFDYSFDLPEPLEIDKQRAFRIQLELLYPNNQPLAERYGLWFTFHFNNKKDVHIPVILLNSDNEEGKMKLETLG